MAGNSNRGNNGRSDNPRLSGDARQVELGTVRNSLDRKADQIAEHAADVGEERLDRSNLDILLTGIIGGIEVSIGAIGAIVIVGAALTAIPGLPLYAALALGGLAFPVGFIFVIMGRSELFTENFLIPVVAVLNRERSIILLLEVLVFSWVGNMVGCALVAVLMSIPGAVGEPIQEGFRAYTAYKLAMPVAGLFTSAILAGMVMTALTWVLLAIHNTVGNILAIAGAGYVLFAANLSHSMVGASILFAGFALVNRGLGDVLIWILIATAGNLVGGIGLVTVFRIVQARTKARAARRAD